MSFGKGATQKSGLITKALYGFQGLVEKKKLNKYNPYAQAYLKIFNDRDRLFKRMVSLKFVIAVCFNLSWQNKLE